MHNIRKFLQTDTSPPQKHQQNSFQFKGRNYLQTHGTATGTKVRIAFGNMFMAQNATQILDKSANTPLVWKCYIDDIISLWKTTKEVAEQFIEQANEHRPTLKFTAELSCTVTTFLDTTIYKEFNEWVL